MPCLCVAPTNTTPLHIYTSPLALLLVHHRLGRLRRLRLAERLLDLRLGLRHLVAVIDALDAEVLALGKRLAVQDGDAVAYPGFWGLVGVVIRLGLGWS